MRVAELVEPTLVAIRTKAFIAPLAMPRALAAAKVQLVNNDV